MQFTVDEYEIIFRRCHPHALGLAYSLLGDGDEARDIAQQAFVNMWESKVRIENPDAFALRSVRNLCISRLEQMKAKDRIRQQYAILAKEEDPEPDSQLENLRKAMDRLLSEREKQAVDEIFDKGSSYKEAAANLSLSTSAINKYICSALKTLRTHFKTKKDK
ncbi:MAG: sigma-70 family RNA polymerase sigma factor [Clostridium sp.]|nr:sigma-70 family RNA polymerase sigma factor [Clostridium sp.]